MPEERPKGESPQQKEAQQPSGGDLSQKNLVIKSFTIVPAQAEVLDKIAKALGVSESELIREAIVLLVGVHKDAL